MAAHTSQFAPIKCEGSQSLPQLYDFQRQHSPDFPLFAYTETATGLTLELTYRQVGERIHYAARRVMEELAISGTTVSTHPVIAVVAVADSITVSTLILGILRAGYIPFLVSPRNSAEAILHLLTQGNARMVYSSNDDATRHKVESSGFPMWIMPTFEELYSPDAVFQLLPDMQGVDMSSTAIIFHSSGSTAFPKIIPVTHRNVEGFYTFAVGNNMLSTNRLHIMGFHALPSFHVMGFSHLASVVHIPITLAVFQPQTPPQAPSPDAFLHFIKQDNVSMIITTPSFLEGWAADEDAVSILKGLTFIGYGGGPLPVSAGEKLSKEGVKISCMYGLTETGFTSDASVVGHPENVKCEDWQYFSLPKHMTCEFVPVSEPSSSHPSGYRGELIIVEKGMYKPSASNTTFNGLSAYETHDILEQHPSNPSLWKIVGRADDQIMLSNGEKTNPGPLEDIMMQDKRIAYAVMFGRARPHNGVLVELKPEFAGKVSSLEEFRESIQGILERVNAYAPTHSHLYKEMVLLALPSKPFEINMKGKPSRVKVLTSYDTEINQAYIDFGSASSLQGDLKKWIVPTPWTEEHLTEFVMGVIEDGIERKVGLDDDIFALGCDSLRSQKIGNVIQACVNESRRLSASTEDGTIMLSSTFAYKHPTPRAMIEALAPNVVTSAAHSSTCGGKSQEQIMEDYVTTLTHGLTPALDASIVQPPSTEVVLVTGTTGALGAHFLADLLARPFIGRVFAFNRGEHAELFDRQQQALVNNGRQSVSLKQEVDTGRVVLLAGDLAKEDWGIDANVFDEMKQSVTLVIHNAWPVNFNYSLESFMPALQGVRNLASFALSSPNKPRVSFMSSVSVLRNPDLLPGPGSAVGLGYGESKWVAERVFDSLLPSVSIVRLGQMAGGPNGAWNAKEWFPAIVLSGPYLKCLPDIPGSNVPFVPGHVAAKVVVDIALDRSNTTRYTLLEHPNPITWTTCMNYVISCLPEHHDIELVPWQTWVEKLEEYTSEGKVPALNASILLEFYQDLEGMTEMGMSDRKPSDVIPRSMPELGKEDVGSWIGFWKERNAF